MKSAKVVSIALFLGLVSTLFISLTLDVSGKDISPNKLVNPHHPNLLIRDHNNQLAAIQLKAKSFKKGPLKQPRLEDIATNLKGISSGISNIQWQKCLGGTIDDYIYGIQQKRDGGYVMAGETSSNNDDVLGNHGCSDIWVVSLDLNGSMQWQECLGGNSSDVAYSVQQTSDLGYVLVGATSSSNGDVSGNHGSSDAWVVKLDSNGALLWQKCLGGSGWDEGRDIQQTTDGGYIVAGVTWSNDGNVTGNHGSSDAWVVKLDSKGALLWQKCLGGSGWDEGRDIQQTTDGGYIVAGVTWSNDGDVSGNHGSSDAWVVKLDSNGSLLWQKCLGGSSSDGANSVQQTRDEGFIVAGETESNDGDVSSNHGSSDAWVVKLDSNGSLLWQRCLGGSDNEYAYSVQHTTDGGYIVAGGTWSNDGDVDGNHGNEDLWMVKLQSNGTMLWQKCLGGSDYEEAHCIIQTKDGGYVAAGYTQSDNGDVSVSHGGSDAWVVKLSGLSNPPGDPAILSGPNSVITGIICNYSTVSTDPDGDQLKYTFDWGDGRTTVTSFVNSGTKGNASQSWIRAGTYKVAAYASDSNGAMSGWSKFLFVTVKNPVSTPKFSRIDDIGYVGLPLEFNASTVNYGNQVMYTFDWGDHTNNTVISPTDPGTIVKVFHIWNRTGPYRIRDKVTNSRGETSEWSDPLNITIIANNPPNTPSAPSGAVFGLTGTAYNYTFSASDPDVDQLMYTLDWGDGTTSVTSLAGSGIILSKTHSWKKAGTYQVKAKGTNSRGLSSGWSTPLNVNIDTPPVVPAKPSGNVSGYANVLYAFSTFATDPDSDKVLYTFDWGDGTTSTTNFVNSGTSASASHRWSVAGNYSIKANATDAKGASSGWSNHLAVVISVNSPPNRPATPIGPASGYAGISYSYLASSTDPDSDRVLYTFDWGDGTNSTTNFFNSGTSASASHAWACGTWFSVSFFVRAKAIDIHGASSESWSNPLRVNITPSIVSVIALQAAANNKYVTADNAGQLPLIANRNSIGSWETFKLIDLGNNNVALQACNSKYITADNAGQLPLIANRNSIGSWETFKLILL